MKLTTSSWAQAPKVIRTRFKIEQAAGTSGNLAAAVQGGGAGSSAVTDTAATGTPHGEFYFSGGSRSAESYILQTGSNNAASVEQRGKGQYARIEQGPGSGNVGLILQDVGVTNATAVIRQTGSGDTYSVVQTLPNQHVVVSQTGNGNSVTSGGPSIPGS